MSKRRTLTAAVALALGLVAGCTSTDEPTAPAATLPDAAGLLSEAAAASRDITSAHFTLKVNGTVEAIPVQNAEGDLTREGGPSGGAKGTVRLTLFGQLIEGEFVLVNESLYIKGPTGGFQQYPASLSANIYDPSAILNPEIGVANILSNIQQPRTEGKEDVDGAPTYKITGRAAQAVVADVIPGVQQDVAITVWIREQDKLPAKASVALPGAQGEATVDLTLSEVGKPVSISPPE